MSQSMSAVEPVGESSSPDAPWKRPLDVAFLVASLPVVLPLGLLIALGIKIVSPGPVLFEQERIGFRGRRFTCWKFRSMKAGACTEAHKQALAEMMKSDAPLTKLDKKGDPRVIPMGALLRSTGLDELPQLLNVWRGEMSLVGPRPCTPYEYEEYLPWQKERFEALPGLTGLWQVSGKNKLTFKQMIQLDIRYAREASLWMDLKIMLKTFPVLCRQAVEMLRRRARDHAGEK